MSRTIAPSACRAAEGSPAPPFAKKAALRMPENRRSPSDPGLEYSFKDVPDSAVETVEAAHPSTHPGKPYGFPTAPTVPTATATTRTRPHQGHKVLPICPVQTVTHLPGCTRFRFDSPTADWSFESARLIAGLWRPSRRHLDGAFDNCVITEV